MPRLDEVEMLRPILQAAQKTFEESGRLPEKVFIDKPQYEEILRVLIPEAYGKGYIGSIKLGIGPDSYLHLTPFDVRDKKEPNFTQPGGSGTATGRMDSSGRYWYSR